MFFLYYSTFTAEYSFKCVSVCTFIVFSQVSIQYVSYVHVLLFIECVACVLVCICQHTGSPLIDYCSPALQVPGSPFVLNIPEWLYNSPTV